MLKNPRSLKILKGHKRIFWLNCCGNLELGVVTLSQLIKILKFEGETNQPRGKKKRQIGKICSPSKFILETFNTPSKFNVHFENLDGSDVL